MTQDTGNRIPSGMWWAMDNACFSNPDFDFARWKRTLDRHRSYAGDRLLFVVAPDVPMDGEATLARFAEYRDRFAALDAPVALVSQNGMGVEDVPWGDIDVLFVGGSTEWKTSQDSAAIVAEAKRRGRWVHMGRVNSLRRLQVAASMGVDSCDGTFLKYGPDANWPRMLRWFEEMQGQPVMVL